MIGFILRLALAGVIACVVVRVVFLTMRSYVHGAQEHAEERADGPPTVDVEIDDLGFRCATCGLVVRILSLPEGLARGGDLKALPHCQEEMQLVTLSSEDAEGEQLST
jgi:hypothetical protein